MERKKKYTYLFNALKIVASILFVVAVYQYFKKNIHGDEIIKSLSNIGIGSILLLAFSCILNWGLESKKWQILVSNVEKINYKRAVKSVLSGAAISNVLPFRIGEYFGRIIYIKKENKLPAAFNSVFGSMCQLAVTIAFGIPFCAIYLEDKYQKISVYGTLVVAGLLIVFTVLFLFSNRLKSKSSNWKTRIIEDIKQFSAFQIISTIVISVIRYIIFASAYSMLIVNLGIVNSFGYAFGCVACIYFLQSFAPSILFTDATVRAALPLVVIKTSVVFEPVILAAAIINYCFNMLLPSAIGLFFVVVKKNESKWE